jgi:hypothetical protein
MKQREAARLYMEGQCRFVQTIEFLATLDRWHSRAIMTLQRKGELQDTEKFGIDRVEACFADPLHVVAVVVWKANWC